MTSSQSMTQKDAEIDELIYNVEQMNALLEREKSNQWIRDSIQLKKKSSFPNSSPNLNSHLNNVDSSDSESMKYSTQMNVTDNSLNKESQKESKLNQDELELLLRNMKLFRSEINNESSFNENNNQSIVESTNRNQDQIQLLENYQAQMNPQTQNQTTASNSYNSQLRAKVSDYVSKFQKESENIHNEFLSTYIELSPELETFSTNFNEIMYILNSTENVLLSFKDRLQTISGEINDLRDKSVDIRQDLLQKRSIESELIAWIQDCLIDSEDVKYIFDGEMNDRWVQILEKIERKNDNLLNWYSQASQNLDEQNESFDSDTESSSSKGTSNSINSKAGRDNQKQFRLFVHTNIHFQILFKKATSRIRHFFLEKILKITNTSNSNPEFTKINVFLKFRFLFHFLKRHEIQISKEIQKTYISIIQKYYLDCFTTYIQSLLKLQVPILSTPWVVRPKKESYETSTSSTWRLISNAQYYLNRKHNVIENEHDILSVRKQLQELNNESKNHPGLGHPIVGHIAIAQKEQIKFEDIFRSVLILLMDTCSSESVFCSEFFQEENMFDSLFQSTIKYINDNLLVVLFNGSIRLNTILFIIFFIDKAKIIMEKRQVNHLDDFLTGIGIKSIMKFKELFDANIHSFQEPISQSEVDSEIKDFIITKRLTSLSILIHLFIQDNPDSPNNHLILSNISHLHHIFVKVLFQIGSNIEKNFDLKKKLKFLIQSLDYILTEFMEYQIHCDDGNQLSEHLQQIVIEFVNFEAIDQFPYLVSFVEEFYPKISKQVSEQINRSNVDIDRISIVAKRFSTEWQSGIESISNDIDFQFKDLDSLRIDIHKQFIVHILKIYNKFREISLSCYQNPPYRSDLVAPERIMKVFGQRR